MHAVIDWLLQTIGAMGYPGIFILMAMESSVIPIPSELVMPPAGYLAQHKLYGGAQSYLPLKVNQAGMIPLIFAIHPKCPMCIGS